MEEVLGMYPPAVDNATEANKLKSLCAGWINIAGWLTLVTTEAIFSGESSLTSKEALLLI